MEWPKQRAWGWYATLIRTPWFCVKLLRFKPRKQLSIQRHQHRYEYWYILYGVGHYKVDELGSEAGCGNSWLIRPEEWHTFKAYRKPVYVLELQYGKKVTENDIERK